MDRMGQPKKSKKTILLIIAIAVVVFIIVAGVVSAFGKMMGSVGNSSGEIGTTGDGMGLDGNIGVIYVEGTIMSSQSTGFFASSTGYNHAFTMDAIDRLMADEENKGLVIFVNSPGGSVYTSDELYFKIKEYQETTGRPVYAAFGSMAASGGYYISAPTDKIVANRNCWTGSIGVTIGTFYDISGLLDTYGVKTVTITSGKNKAMGSRVEPMTEEQLAIFQGLVDESYDQFVGIVSEGRSMEEEAVRTLADGRIYTAKQAVDNGLVDEIGTLDETIALMTSDYDLGDCQINTLKPRELTFLETLLSESLIARKQAGDVRALLELINDDGGVPISYMCEILE